MHLGTDGKQLWIADDSQKVAITRPLPELAREHLLYLLLAAASTAELKKRFDMAVDPDDETKFNKYYMHIVLTPRSKEDREHFKKAELVLWKNEDDDRFKKYFMLPARLWIQKSNGEQSNWEFKGLTPKELTKDDFALPKLAADWKVEAVPDVPSAGKRK